MSRMLKISAYLIASLSFFGVVNSTQAGILFELNATTIDADGAFSLDDVITGSIEIEEGAAQAGAFFSTADLIGFSFAAGDVVLDFAASFVSNLQGQISGDGTGFSFLTLDLETDPQSNGCGDSGCFAAFEVDLIDQAVITNVDLFGDPNVTGFIVADIGFDRVVNVSEPANLAILFALGFFGIAGFRNRKCGATSKASTKA